MLGAVIDTRRLIKLCHRNGSACDIGDRAAKNFRKEKLINLSGLWIKYTERAYNVLGIQYGSC